MVTYFRFTALQRGSPGRWLTGSGAAGGDVPGACEVLGGAGGFGAASGGWAGVRGVRDPL